MAKKRREMPGKPGEPLPAADAQAAIMVAPIVNVVDTATDERRRCGFGNWRTQTPLRFSLAEAARAMGAQTALTGEVCSFSIDSRTLQPGDLFFAIVGDVQDGHAFVDDVLARGAAGAVVHRDLGTSDRLIRVGDTLEALQQLAKWAAARWGGPVVGVTGSAGKTTTKDVIAAVLGSAMPVGKTIGNFNNHVGLPLSLLRMPQEATVAVLEYGMNHAGEIAALGRIVQPDVAVVTNVGYAHIENFDSIDAIAASKRELVEALKSDGVAVLNADDRARPSVPGTADRVLRFIAGDEYRTSRRRRPVPRGRRRVRKPDARKARHQQYTRRTCCRSSVWH